MFATKVVIFLCLSLALVNAVPNEDVPVLGGVRPVSDLKNAEKVLNRSLLKLASGEGPSYRIGKIYSATQQVVAGTSHKIVADLIDGDGNTKKCNISIWSREWLPEGIEITFECPGEQKLVKKHSA